MARAKTKNVDGTVPEYVQKSAVMRRTKVTKRQLPSFTEAMLLIHTPELQRLYFASLLKSLTKGDRHAQRLVAEMFELVKGGGGITLVNAMLQQNVAAGEAAPVKGFDAFVRQLKESREGRSLMPAPDPGVIEVRPAESVPAGD